MFRRPLYGSDVWRMQIIRLCAGRRSAVASRECHSDLLLVTIPSVGAPRGESSISAVASAWESTSYTPVRMATSKEEHARQPTNHPVPMGRLRSPRYRIFSPLL